MNVVRIRLVRSVPFLQESVDCLFQILCWQATFWYSQLAMDNMGDAGVVIWKVLPGHNILAGGTLNEQVPKFVARKALEDEFLQQTLIVEETLRVFTL